MTDPHAPALLLPHADAELIREALQAMLLDAEWGAYYLGLVADGSILPKRGAPGLALRRATHPAGDPRDIATAALSALSRAQPAQGEAPTPSEAMRELGLLMGRGEPKVLEYLTDLQRRWAASPPATEALP